MIGGLLHKLRSGKRERPEMKSDFWLIKRGDVFLTVFLGKITYSLDRDIYYIVSDLT